MVVQLVVCMKDHGDTVVSVHEGPWWSSCWCARRTMVVQLLVCMKDHGGPVVGVHEGPW